MFISETSSIENIEENFPDILYKYRNWSDINHKTILSKQEVFFAAPESFSDKNDCRFPIDWNFTYESFRPYLNATFPGDKTLLLKKDYEFELKNQYNSILGTEEKRLQFIEEYYFLSNYHLGILSLTARNDNTEIWKSDYAVNFSGFCVGIDFKKCLELLAKNKIGGGKISYVPESHPKFEYVSPHLTTGNEVLELFIKTLHTKYLPYGFEEEYRLTKYLFDNDYWNEVLIEDRKFVVPKECFKSIIFGYKMTDSDIREIINLCNQQELKVDFFKAILTDKDQVLLEPVSANLYL